MQQPGESHSKWRSSQAGGFGPAGPALPLVIRASPGIFRSLPLILGRGRLSCLVNSVVHRLRLISLIYDSPPRRVRPAVRREPPPLADAGAHASKIPHSPAAKRHRLFRGSRTDSAGDRRPPSRRGHRRARPFGGRGKHKCSEANFASFSGLRLADDGQETGISLCHAMEMTGQTEGHEGFLRAGERGTRAPSSPGNLAAGRRSRRSSFS